MTAEITELSQWGIPGILLAGVCGYVLLIEKRHKSEREEWLRAIQNQQEESNKNIRENTSVLSSLKTLLETRIR